MKVKLSEYQTLPQLNKIEGVKPLPSVSKIFQTTDASVQQMVRVLKDKKSKQGEVMRKAVSTGNSAHKVIENKQVIKTEDTAKNLLMEAILEEYHKSFEPIIEEEYAKEKGVYYPSQYKGKFDAVGVINGKVTLWDYKKTNAPKRKSGMRTYFKQICAYRLAHNLIYENQIEQVGLLNIFGKKAEDVDSQIIMLDSEELDYYTNLFNIDLSKYNELMNNQPAV